MKRLFLSTILSLALLVAAVIVTYLPASADSVYVFGFADPNSVEAETSPRPAFNKQNVDNFYAFYSMEYNKGGIINTNTLKECIYTNYKNSYSMKFMQPANEDVDKYYAWWPSKYPPTAENPNPTQFWWRIDKKGTVCPAGNMSAVVAFKAPADGTYIIDAQCDGGAKPDGKDEPNSDGVSFAVLHGGKALWSYNSKKTFASVDKVNKVPQKTLTLKKNDFVYFVSDPNGFFEYDAAHWFVKITQSTQAQPPGPGVSSKAGSQQQTPSGAGTVSKISSGSTTSTNVSGGAVVSGGNVDVSTGDTDNSIDTTVEAQESTMDGSQTSTNESNVSNDEEKDSGSALPWIIGIGIIVLAGGGVGGYFFIKKTRT